MKKIRLFALLFLLSAFAWAGTPPIPADYSISVHVSVSRIVSEGNARGWQRLNVVIDGKKYELESDSTPFQLLALGDYKAKLVRDEHHTTYDSYQVYEFLLPDQKTRRFIVVGQTD